MPTDRDRLGALVRVLFQSIGSHGWLYRDDAAIEAAVAMTPGARHATDLAFRADGRVVCVVGELVTLEARGERSFATNESPAGAYTLYAPPSFRGVSATGRSDDAVAACFLGEQLVTAHRDGSVKVGGRTIAEIPRVRTMSASGTGVLAIAAEHDGGSKVHLLEGSHVVAVLDGGLPIGGVAWSPDGLRLARRTSRGIAIHDASGALLGEHPLSGAHTAVGHVAWSAHGVVALDGGDLAHLDRQGVLELIRAPSAPWLNLAAMREGRFVAVATSEASLGLSVIDLSTHAVATVPWATRILPWTPMRFSPGDRALVWADVAGLLIVVPFGDVAVDERGLAIDPELQLINELSRIQLRDLSDAELRAMGERVRTATFRASLQSRAANLRGAIDTVLRDRVKASSKGMFDKPTTPAGAAPFAVGAKVAHAKFGEGAVTATSGAGDTAEITVAFAGGPKTLRASFLRAI